MSETWVTIIQILREGARRARRAALAAPPNLSLELEKIARDFERELEEATAETTGRADSA